MEEVQLEEAHRPGLLSEPEQLQLVTRLALFEKPKKVMAWAKDELGKTISRSTILYYQTSDKWKPFIQKVRNEYNQGIMEVPMANKRRRIEAFETLYEKALNKDDLCEARNQLREIREEVEGKPNRDGQPSIFIAQQFNSLTDEELEQKRMETLEQLARFKAKGLLGSRMKEITNASN